MSIRQGTLRITEVLCWAVGFLLCGFFLSQLVQGEVRRSEDIGRVELAWTQQLPDQSLWSEERVEAWEASRATAPADVVAVLAMPELGLKVPVYENASELNMDRGASLIKGTARPDEVGNVGIAGHRDGYFRVLKDAAIGDALILQTAGGERRYRVDEILIVDPLDVEVLDSSDDQRVTLVTCYPFYFVGAAPRRYILKAQLDELPSMQ